MRRKLIISLVMLISTSIIFQFNKVNAILLYADGDTPASKNRNTWMTEIRKIESLGGMLGLTEEQNDDLTSKTGSNGLDVHLQKNTEYGAMALLSASSYGKPNKIQDGETTTGNETGVVMPYKTEWTAAHYTTTLGRTTYADRYVNYYDTTNNKKNGDATFETNKWHGTTYSYVHNQAVNTGWPGSVYNPHGIVRNCFNNGIFAWTNEGYVTVVYEYGDRARPHGGWTGAANLSKEYAARAVIINGEDV